MSARAFAQVLPERVICQDLFVDRPYNLLAQHKTIARSMSTTRMGYTSQANRSQAARSAQGIQTSSTRLTNTHQPQERLRAFSNSN